MSPAATDELIDDLLAGKHRALARVITTIENRRPGYRELVSELHEHTGHADVVGITGSPGAGKSTLVDKADLDGADRTVQELEEMVHMRSETPATGHHGPDAAMPGADAHHGDGDAADDEDEEWTPPVLTAVAKSGDGVEEFLETLDDHRAFLERTGRLEERTRSRYAEEIRQLLREDVRDIVDDEVAARGGLEGYVDSVLDRESDPYTVADEVLAPLRGCVEERRD